jgi:hypothetical protein
MTQESISKSVFLAMRSRVKRSHPGGLPMKKALFVRPFVRPFMHITSGLMKEFL